MTLVPVREERAPAPTGSPEAAPPSVSGRRRLRDGLPELYRESEFTMRFVLGFEEVLDPIVATLDSLTAHFDADLAPPHALAGLATWLGVDEVEALPASRRRTALHRAGELARLRGTAEGLRLVLDLFFPDVPLRIEDHGSVLIGEEAGDPPKAKAAAFDVYSDRPLEPAMQQAIAQCIERWKPAHARPRLRVKKGSATTVDMPAATPTPLPTQDDTPEPPA